MALKETQVTCATAQALQRVRRIAHAETGGGVRHQLHQALRTLGRGRHRVVAGFDGDNGVQQLRIQLVLACHLIDQFVEQRRLLPVVGRGLDGRHRVTA
ncbi:hypothetical protein D3C78_1503690 [compost metagenome]